MEQHVLLGVKKPFTCLKVGRCCSVRALAALKLAALWKKAVILLLWILLLPEPWRGIRRVLGTLLIWESGQGKIKAEDINTGWLAHMYLIFKISEKCCWFVSPCLSSCRVTELLLKWVRKKCYFLALTWHSTLETSVVGGKLNLPCTCCCHMEFRVAFNSGFFSLSYSGPTISTKLHLIHISKLCAYCSNSTSRISFKSTTVTVSLINLLDILFLNWRLMRIQVAHVIFYFFPKFSHYCDACYISWIHSWVSHWCSVYKAILQYHLKYDHDYDYRSIYWFLYL